MVERRMRNAKKTKSAEKPIAQGTCPQASNLSEGQTVRKAIQTLNESASVLEGARILTECFAYSEKHHSSPAATEYAMAALGALLEACAQRADGAAAQLDRILKA